MSDNNSRNKCPICNNPKATTASDQRIDAVRVHCPTCGRCLVDDPLIEPGEDGFIIQEDIKSCMYYFLTQHRKEQKKEDRRLVNFIFDRNKTVDPDAVLTMSKEGLMNIFPADMDAHLSMILVNFVNLCERPGNLIFESTTVLDVSHLFFLKEGQESKKVEEIRWWLETLKTMDYVKQKFKNGYELTLEGWKRADSFAKTQTTSKTVFVAMNFADELQSVKAEIKRAIESTGFTPMVIEDKEHNNQILPEILHEIRKSRFVVADFTNQRGGVYYEAGYAEGLGIPLIAMCRKDDFGNIHFDLKQKNTILWEIPEDIYDKLVKRIKATLDLH